MRTAAVALAVSLSLLGCKKKSDDARGGSGASGASASSATGP